MFEKIMVEQDRPPPPLLIKAFVMDFLNPCYFYAVHEFKIGTSKDRLYVQVCYLVMKIPGLDRTQHWLI